MIINFFKKTFIVKNPEQSAQLGFSLIEVMVSALIISIAALGVSSLLIVAMKGTQHSLMKQHAIGLLDNMVESMRSNALALNAYEFNSRSFNCGQSLPNCSTSGCLPAQVALIDQYNIVCGYGSNSKTNALKVTSTDDIGILNDGSIAVSCIPAGNCANNNIQITVGWVERAFGEEQVSRDSLMLTTRIGP